MKLRTFILTGIAMCFLSLTVFAEVIVKTSSQSIVASTDKEGVSGYRGCYTSSLRAAPAYKYELQTYTYSDETPSCAATNKKKWKIVEIKNSDNNQVAFNNLQEGEYRLICFSGQPTGCFIESETETHPNQAIIYEIEKSENFFIDKSASFDSYVKSNTKKSLLVYPNPGNDLINVELMSQPKTKVVNIEILDLFGNQAYSEKHGTEPRKQLHKWTILTNEIPSGTYVIRVHDDIGNVYFEKIIIMHDKTNPNPHNTGPIKN